MDQDKNKKTTEDTNNQSAGVPADTSVTPSTPTTPSTDTPTPVVPPATDPVTPTTPPAVESTPTTTAPTPSTSTTETTAPSSSFSDPMSTTPTTPDAYSSAPSTDSGLTPPAQPPIQDPTTPQDPGYAQTKSHNMMFIIIGIVVLVIISLVVLFFYRQFTGMIGGADDVTPSPVAVTSPTEPPVSPTVTPVNEEEAELQQIDLSPIDESLDDIEKDIGDL